MNPNDELFNGYEDLNLQVAYEPKLDTPSIVPGDQDGRFIDGYTSHWDGAYDANLPHWDGPYNARTPKSVPASACPLQSKTQPRKIPARLRKRHARESD